MTPQDQAYLQGFITKCAEYGVDPELMAKEANLLSAGAKLLQRFGDKMVQQGAKGLKAVPGVGNKVNATSTTLVPRGVTPSGGVLDDLAAGRLFLTPGMSKSLAGGTLLGGGYLLNKMMGNGGGAEDQAVVQGTQYAADGWHPMQYYQPPAGLAGVYPYM